MKFSICNEIFQGWKLEDVFRSAKSIGYDAVEIAPFTLAESVEQISAEERARIRESAKNAGIGISGIHWVLVKPDGLSINGPDAAVRERTAGYFKELVDFCADIGGRAIVVGSPKQRQILPGVTAAQAGEWTLETFRPAVARAEERGVVICLEPLGEAETNFINTAAQAVELTEQLHSKAFQIILDVKAMYAEGRPLPQIIRESRGKFAYFHANDRNLKGPGFGDVDFVPIFRALREVGYDGVVSVEVFKFEEGPQEIATRSLETLKKAWQQANL
ncbi:MAG: sugar phosphate isomerase/epimerase [Verrucomicrobia bacterium]|jgi:sugar phosphate isomerase/epimerase|nr:sugar phosphate isomerase/epimerase [Verrucomicrobiota bacterium]